MSRPGRNITLNLLQALDALLIECNVSRAAARMGVSQSTMSNNLADLRQLFSDPLLVRQGSGLVATARAVAAVKQVRQALRQITDAIDGAGQVEPDKADRTFSIVAADFVQPLFTMPLFERWRRSSSRVELAVLPLVLDDLQEQLASGRVDAAIVKSRSAPTSLRQAPLFADHFVVLARHQHDVLGHGPIDLEKYLSCLHVGISASWGHAGSSVDDALKQLGHSRRIEVRVPQYLMAAHLAASTDLVATVPSTFARSTLVDPRLVAFPLPFEMDAVQVLLLWHERSHNEPSHRWLRAGLRSVADAVVHQDEARPPERI